MTDYAMQARPAGRSGTPRPKRRPGRKPKGSGPVVVPEAADKPDPGHVLTWRQRKVLQVIRESVQRRGYPPSMREIGEAVGLTSTSSVSYQLSTLQNKGYLRRDAGRPRTVEVRLPGHPAIRPEPGIDDDAPMDITSQEAAYVPLVGRIAAGGPILAEQSIEERAADEAAATCHAYTCWPCQRQRTHAHLLLRRQLKTIKIGLRLV